MPSPIVAPTGFDKVTVKLSLGSLSRSPTIGTVTVRVACPAAKVTVWPAAGSAV